MKSIIGITGGIGSGKTIVSNMFFNLGVPIIDSDLISKSLILPGSSPLNIIKKRFGKSFFNKLGFLKTKKLRKKIFEEKKERNWINNLLHPLIYKKMKDLIRSTSFSYVLLVIPLLVENKLEKFLDWVITVDCTEDEQIKRIKTRDKIKEEEVRMILLSQSSRYERLKKSNDIIKNHDNSNLETEIFNLHKKYIGK
ncbi:hypothetical protein AOE58_01325 [Candidatus Riesia pthiripubis]|uniref:Dephospho-CoA kinase n=1 Tax=Candidatus Riesia pthiripubis TaxID=428412 RepID=A0A1V0HPF9_9ENTR|nr:hypothetical protein AOE58_01325 [Candidatus Riesia pthiripubis]